MSKKEKEKPPQAYGDNSLPPEASLSPAPPIWTQVPVLSSWKEIKEYPVQLCTGVNLALGR